MTSLTIEISAEQLRELQAMAERFGVSTEDLVRVSLDEILSLPDDEFKRVADYLLHKNAKLYQRLA